MRTVIVEKISLKEKKMFDLSDVIKIIEENIFMRLEIIIWKN